MGQQREKTERVQQIVKKNYHSLYSQIFELCFLCTTKIGQVSLEGEEGGGGGGVELPPSSSLSKFPDTLKMRRKKNSEWKKFKSEKKNIVFAEVLLLLLSSLDFTNPSTKF